MWVLLCVCLSMTCLGAQGARARTVRRNLSLKPDEKKFVEEVGTFLGETEGTASKDYWTSSSDVKPMETFGLMQKAFISDMVLQSCIMSGVYLRQGDGTTSTTTTTRTEKLVSRLLDLLKTKRMPTEAPMTTEMNWEDDPLNMLEDAENQFRNLCFTLFELRRLNKKLAAEGKQTTTPMM